MRLLYILTALAFLGCGASKKDEESAKKPTPEVPAPTPEAPSVFASEINPILEKSCGGCHSPGAKHTPFVGDEALTQATGDGIAARITTSDPKLYMPPARAREPLTSEETQKLLQFLGKS